MFKDKLRLAGLKLKSFRYWSAVGIAFLVLIIVFGAVQASGAMQATGPMGPSHPPGGGGMWEMPSRPWWPMAPVPTIMIVAVEKNVSVTIETENLPEDEDFTVTMGTIYTRGKDGYVMGAFNSGDGESQELTFDIPVELEDEYRIAIRAQTDHTFPYYAFNWFYNNSTDIPPVIAPSTDAADDTVAAGTGGAEDESQPSAEEAEQTLLVLEEEDEPVPSFIICDVMKDEEVFFITSDFPEGKLFTVKMGVMPNYSRVEQYYDGKMKPWDNTGMDMHGKPPHPMPPMYPPGQEEPMKPSKIWIPYFEAGTFESVAGGENMVEMDIPAELTGAYKISIMMYSDDTYPYYAYNFFYNNDASVCK